MAKPVKKKKNKTAKKLPETQVSDTYEIIVRFERSLSDDLGVIEKEYGGAPVKECLIAQLCKELQAAYDHPAVAIAGRFQVISGPTLQIVDR